MSLAVLYSRASLGLQAPLVTVEIHLSNGMPQMSIVGLPEAAVRESKDRVRSAVINSNFEFPARRITINLAPADLPKEGGRFDLPIALGILAASGQLNADKFGDHEFVGELALSGELRAINGIFAVSLACNDSGRYLVVPKLNIIEATMAQNERVFAGNHLLEICAHLSDENCLTPYPVHIPTNTENSAPDLADVRGHEHAKRALEIAASGGHSILMVGPPGTGKTLLATRLPSLLPALNCNEAREVASILSLANKPILPHIFRQRPFRAPHHTASSVSLVGGGSNPRPGEISLAHHGILFLDELPEFNRHVLETLREPIESGKITISRASQQLEFPAQFQLISAMNPCPCGYAGDPQGQCRCTPERIQRYRQKISGPLLDRLDMQLTIPRLTPEELLQPQPESITTSAIVRARVTEVRELQMQRQGKLNIALGTQEMAEYCEYDEKTRAVLQHAMQKLHLSARSIHRILKLARTIADIEHAKNINSTHVLESLSYRQQVVKSNAG